MSKNLQFIEDNLILLSKQTLDLFLKQKNPADLISLYIFYYYTAKWQKTNQPQVAIDFVANGLHWGQTKIIRTKKLLEDLGLIQEIKRINIQTGRITGWYIKLNYIWKKDTIGLENFAHIPHLPYLVKSTSGKQQRNALNADNKVVVAKPFLTPQSEQREKKERTIGQQTRKTHSNIEPLSAEKLWQIAGEKNVRFEDVREIHKNILADINGPNKYKIKSINLALYKWIQYRLSRGMRQMNELERLDWGVSNPDVVAKDREQTRILVEMGIL